MDTIGNTTLIRKAAIFGAAGAIGQSLAPELERRGIPFRVVGRSKARLQQSFGNLSHAEIFDGDIGDLRTAGAAAREVDTIFYCVGVPYPSFHLHPILTRTALEAAATMKVQRFVLECLHVRRAADLACGGDASARARNAERHVAARAGRYGFGCSQ
jgi:uncharacterized protein YbjT (DUF2867 family)